MATFTGHAGVVYSEGPHQVSLGSAAYGGDPGPATLRHHDAVIGTLRAAGFSVVMTAHAVALIDSYIFGFALCETTSPINGPETVTEGAESMMPQDSADLYPHLIEFATEHILKPDYDFGNEFEFGLNAILDALSTSGP